MDSFLILMLIDINSENVAIQVVKFFSDKYHKILIKNLRKKSKFSILQTTSQMKMLNTVNLKPQLNNFHDLTQLGETFCLKDLKGTLQPIYPACLRYSID